MLVETARVVAVEPGAVWVEAIRQSTCGSCAANKGCGHGLLNRLGDGRSSYIRVLAGDVDATDCSVDDQVRIGIPEQVILRGSFLLYMLPLVLMLAGAGGAQWLWPSAGSLVSAGPELAAIGGAVIGLALGFVIVRWHAWQHREDRTIQPTLVEVLPRANLPLQSV